MKKLLAVMAMVAVTFAAFAAPKKVTYKWVNEDVSDAKLFKTFGGCGVQIWQDEWNDHDLTFTLDYAEGKITVGKVGWWGGAFGAYDNGVSNGATFNLSNVAEIRFTAKASSYGTVYFKLDNKNNFEVDIPTEWREVSLPVKGASKKTDVLFMIGGLRDVNIPGTEITLKNISFYDKKGNEITPQYN